MFSSELDVVVRRISTSPSPASRWGHEPSRASPGSCSRVVLGIPAQGCTPKPCCGISFGITALKAAFPRCSLCWELWAGAAPEALVVAQGTVMAQRTVMAQDGACINAFQLLIAMQGLCWAAQCLRRSLPGSGGCSGLRFGLRFSSLACLCPCPHWLWGPSHAVWRLTQELHLWMC